MLGTIESGDRISNLSRNRRRTGLTVGTTAPSLVVGGIRIIRMPFGLGSEGTEPGAADKVLVGVMAPYRSRRVNRADTASPLRRYRGIPRRLRR